MALNFPTPSQLAAQYLVILKSLKPEVDTSRQDSDWWIRSQVVGGVMSGVYADQQLVSQDAFPQSARLSALVNHLYTYFGSGLIQPQPSSGSIAVTGTNGLDIPVGTQWVYLPNGNSYQTTSDVVLSGTTGILPIQSIGVGQVQNLLDQAPLQCSTPPAGLNPNAVAIGPIGSGRDQETQAEAAARILAFIQSPPAGGTVTDYVAFAKAGSPQVVGANVIRWILGFGSIGIVITAGTTDIDTALNDGVPIVLIPSQATINTVQAYVNTQKVVTDCVTVFAPTPLNVTITVWVRFLSGNAATIEPNTGLTQDALVKREIQRAVYKTPPGGRQFNGQGYLVVSEIEQQLDASLSAEPYATGSYAQILLDRRVESLQPGIPDPDSEPDLPMTAVQLAIPFVINVNTM